MKTALITIGLSTALLLLAFLHDNARQTRNGLLARNAFLR
jgi:multisubunit Na+/H+ antiporter MnhB subunit